MEVIQVDKYGTAIEVCWELLEDMRIKHLRIEVEFIVGLCTSVQEQLARTDRLNQFNTTAFVIHMLYGPDFGRMRFKKYLTYFRPSGNFMAGYKFASRSKACLAYIRAHEARRGEAS